MKFYLCLVLLILPRFSCQTKNSSELIKSYGLPAEEHEIVTEDGYIITIFRIPRPGANVVLLDHGVPSNSDGYLVLGRNMSLSNPRCPALKGKVLYTVCSAGCLMYDNGNDVWLANHRGTRYGKQTLNDPDPTSHDQKFWDYSMDEVALYDESAIIDYILNVTQQPNLNYIGHSAGPAEFLALLSSKPEYNTKVKSAVVMAPAVFPIKEYRFTTIGIGLSLTDINYDIRRLFHIYEAHGPSPVVRQVVDSMCTSLPSLCKVNIESFLGSDWRAIDKQFLPLQVSTQFGHGATSIYHIRQLGDNIRPDGNNFTKFDYGTKINKEKYGTENPPAYDLSRVQVPVFVFVSTHDSLVDPYAIQTLREHVTTVKYTNVITGPIGHLDFILGAKAKDLVYDHILDLYRVQISQL